MPSTAFSLALATGLFSLAAATPYRRECVTAFDPCSSTDDCCDRNVCASTSDWDPAGPHACLPPPPKCHGKGNRCKGAPGQEYVPFAPCCDTRLECREVPERGWGSFCVAEEREEPEARPSPEVTEEREEPEARPSPEVTMRPTRPPVVVVTETTRQPTGVVTEPTRPPTAIITEPTEPPVECTEKGGSGRDDGDRKCYEGLFCNKFDYGSGCQDSPPTSCTEKGGSGCDGGDHECCADLFCNKLDNGDSECQDSPPVVCSEDGAACDDGDHECCGDSVCNEDNRETGPVFRAAKREEYY